LSLLFYVVFISAKTKEYSVVETGRPFLKKISYLSLVAWIAGIAFLFVYDGPRGSVTAEWVVSSFGVYFFAYLSILETKPPEEVTRRSTKNLEPFISSINSVVVSQKEVNENGEADEEPKRLQLREDCYAMTWCGF
jgi:hypothetical protein